MRKILLISGLLSMISAAPAARATIMTYDVVVTFHEPDTQPYNTIFTGSFTYDTVTATASNLHGSLTESMMGTSSLALSYQLSSVYDAGLGGLLVTTFRNGSTNTLSTMDGGDAPGRREDQEVVAGHGGIISFRGIKRRRIDNS